MSETAFNPPRIVGLDGRPLRPGDGHCPQCYASKEKRVPSSGFGQPHDICSNCGHEFQEFTCQS